MKHLVFTVNNKFISFRMGDQMGTHPAEAHEVQSVIDYLIKMIRPDTFEIL
jgi:hypothetical protein